MSSQYQTLSFQVRIRENVKISVLAERLSRVLGCPFMLGQSDSREDENVYLANTLGLEIKLSELVDIGVDRHPGDGYFVLIGFVHEKWLHQWPVDTNMISISLYMMQLLKVIDNSGWFIPAKEEILQEAGLMTNL